MARATFDIAVAAFAMTLLISGCSRSRTFTVHGMDDGYKRYWGGDFYGVDRGRKAPPGHWESIIWSRDLYYRTHKLDESSYAEVSPSGRYAVYHSELYGGILLFDSQSGRIYRIGKGIAGPYDAKWRLGERAFTMRYYPVDPNDDETTDVDIASLRPIGTLESPPPHLR